MSDADISIIKPHNEDVNGWVFFNVIKDMFRFFVKDFSSHTSYVRKLDS